MAVGTCAAAVTSPGDRVVAKPEAAAGVAVAHCIPCVASSALARYHPSRRPREAACSISSTGSSTMRAPVLFLAEAIRARLQGAAMWGSPTAGAGLAETRS